jgi:hypothetical protein
MPRRLEGRERQLRRPSAKDVLRRVREKMPKRLRSGHKVDTALQFEDSVEDELGHCFVSPPSEALNDGRRQATRLSERAEQPGRVSAHRLGACCVRGAGEQETEKVRLVAKIAHGGSEVPRHPGLSNETVPARCPEHVAGYRPQAAGDHTSE